MGNLHTKGVLPAEVFAVSKDWQPLEGHLSQAINFFFKMSKYHSTQKNLKYIYMYKTSSYLAAFTMFDHYFSALSSMHSFYLGGSYSIPFSTAGYSP